MGKKRSTHTTTPGSETASAASSCVVFLPGALTPKSFRPRKCHHFCLSLFTSPSASSSPGMSCLCFLNDAYDSLITLNRKSRMGIDQPVSSTTDSMCSSKAGLTVRHGAQFVCSVITQTVAEPWQAQAHTEETPVRKQRCTPLSNNGHLVPLFY